MWKEAGGIKEILIQIWKKDGPKCEKNHNKHLGKSSEAYGKLWGSLKTCGDF